MLSSNKKPIKNQLFLILLLSLAYFFWGCGGLVHSFPYAGYLNNNLVPFAIPISATNSVSDYTINSSTDPSPRENLSRNYREELWYHSVRSTNNNEEVWNYYGSDYLFNPSGSRSDNGRTVYDVLLWLKVDRTWDETQGEYNLSLDRGSSLIARTIDLSIANNTADTLHIQIPEVYINGTNNSLSRNFVYKDDPELTFWAITNYFDLSQDECYFPEVNVSLTGSTNRVERSLSLNVTNDLVGNGYYCYTTPVVINTNL